MVGENLNRQIIDHLNRQTISCYDKFILKSYQHITQLKYRTGIDINGIIIANCNQAERQHDFVEGISTV
jgi:hypothetical protein